MKLFKSRIRTYELQILKKKTTRDILVLICKIKSIIISQREKEPKMTSTLLSVTELMTKYNGYSGTEEYKSKPILTVPK